MSKELEPLTLAELQTNKDLLESQAQHFRTELHELARSRPDNWQARFAEVQSELIAVVAQTGQLERRIRATVEGAIVSEEDAHDA